MKSKILFGIKHSESLLNVFELSKYINKHNLDYSIHLICLFKLNNKQIESAENLKIDLIKVNSFFLINQDLKKENYLIYNLKLILFNKYIKSKYSIISKCKILIISPGGFLLDQIVAHFFFLNKPSFLLQNGYISNYEDKKSKRKKEVNKFLKKLLMFFETYKLRINLNKQNEWPKVMAFSENYKEFLNKKFNLKSKAYVVGSPRMKSVDNEIKNLNKILYVGSSAIYENRIDLHNFTINQISKINSLMDKNLFELSFRPHPRDKSNWEKLLIGTGIKILDSEINLDNQIPEHGYVVAEGSTVIIQSILSSRIGIWINKKNELLEKYPNISLETEEEFIDKLNKIKSNNLLYAELLQSQKNILKKNILTFDGEESCKNIIDIIKDYE